MYGETNLQGKMMMMTQTIEVIHEIARVSCFHLELLTRQRYGEFPRPNRTHKKHAINRMQRRKFTPANN